MKQVFKNQYIKSFKFHSPKEQNDFIINQSISKVLFLESTCKDNYYCYVSYHSLTKEKQFIISFSSDEQQENLSLLFWQKQNRFVLDVGKNIYILTDDLEIQATIYVSTPLIGLYITNGDNLLVLEEAALKFVEPNGNILQNTLFDLVEEFSINGNQLFIRTSEENKVFELV